MRLLDSRRLTGPNLLCDRPGAIIEVSFDDEDLSTTLSGVAVHAWERHARALLDAVGWAGEQVHFRVWPGGASLAITAPVDALYAATDLNEIAWEAAVEELDGRAIPEQNSAMALGEAAVELREEIESEHNPALLALREAAEERGVAFLMDDEEVTVGLGAGSQSWSVNAIPSLEQIEWEAVRDIPLALVTGTNGKTTTVRLLAAIGKAAGVVAGNTSTDGVQVDGKIVLAGDYTGPEGARTLLRERNVGMAVLEIARGGMLRRGLPVARANVALVTNVAPDHLGDYGICDVESLADAKMVVTRALGPGSRLVLNADDPLIVERAGRAVCPITWISTTEDLPPTEVLSRLTSPAGAADDIWQVRGGDIVHCPGEHVAQCFGEGMPVEDAGEPFMSIDEAPITLDGAARFNVYNVIGAIALARALSLPDDSIRAGLRGFTGSSEENLGRGNLFEFGSTRVMVDFAHNPHGLESVFEMIGELSPRRWLVTLAQAGDRDDESIREMARLAWKAGADRFIVKDLPGKLRGREPGEVPRLLERELLDLGASPATIERAASDFDSVEKALAWAQDGDLLLLLLYDERSRTLDLLNGLSARGWTPGTPI